MAERQDLIARLNRLLEREYHSLVVFLSDSEPWVPEDQREEKMTMLRRMAAENRAQAERLADLVSDLGGVPLLGNFPAKVSELSYLALSHGLKLAIEWEDEQMRLCDEILERYGAEPYVQKAVRRVRDGATIQKDRLERALRNLSAPGDASA